MKLKSVLSNLCVKIPLKDFCTKIAKHRLQLLGITLGSLECGLSHDLKLKSLFSNLRVKIPKSLYTKKKSEPIIALAILAYSK